MGSNFKMAILRYESNIFPKTHNNTPVELENKHPRACNLWFSTKTRPVSPLFFPVIPLHYDDGGGDGDDNNGGGQFTPFVRTPREVVTRPLNDFLS